MENMQNIILGFVRRDNDEELYEELEIMWFQVKLICIALKKLKKKKKHMRAEIKLIAQTMSMIDFAHLDEAREEIVHVLIDFLGKEYKRKDILKAFEQYQRQIERDIENL